MKLFKRNKKNSSNGNTKDELLDSYKRKYFNELEHKVKRILYAHIKDFANKIELEDVGYNEGDLCVVDRYNATGKAYNSWDSGSSHLLNTLGSDIPIIVKIKKIYADVSRAYDFVDSYLDGLNMDFFDGLSKDDIISHYEAWFHSIRTNYRNLGIYPASSYELVSHSMKNLSPIHSNSFINIDSRMGLRTIEIWRRDIELDLYEKCLKNSRKKLVDMKNELYIEGGNWK